MNLEDQLEDMLDRVIGQFDNYAFFVGRYYKDQMEGITEYCGYPVFLVLLIEEKDDTIYFAPIDNFYIQSMN
jgi:hypothetical protein